MYSIAIVRSSRTYNLERNSFPGLDETSARISVENDIELSSLQAWTSNFMKMVKLWLFLTPIRVSV